MNEEAFEATEIAQDASTGAEDAWDENESNQDQSQTFVSESGSTFKVTKRRHRKKPKKNVGE